METGGLLEWKLPGLRSQTANVLQGEGSVSREKKLLWRVKHDVY